MNRIPYLFAVSFLMGCSAWGMGKKSGADQAITPPVSSSEESVAGEGYRSRYPLATASQKLVDNQGDGHKELYGVRNFRAVLNGIYYRGGANNAFNKEEGKRNNSNPLPNGGLKNLCEEGFTQAVYLYPTRFSTAPKSVSCRTYAGHDNTLAYAQISPLSGRREDQKKLLSLINDRIRDSHLGPIYDHCWNGWHASGYVASITLQQFCGFTHDQAVDYWNINTDGVNKGVAYDAVRRMVRAFEPFPEFTLSDAEKAALCPAPGSLKFR